MKREDDLPGSLQIFTVKIQDDSPILSSCEDNFSVPVPKKIDFNAPLSARDNRV